MKLPGRTPMPCRNQMQPKTNRTIPIALNAIFILVFEPPSVCASGLGSLLPNRNSKSAWSLLGIFLTLLGVPPSRFEIAYIRRVYLDLLSLIADFTLLALAFPRNAICNPEGHRGQPEGNSHGDDQCPVHLPPRLVSEVCAVDGRKVPIERWIGLTSRAR